MIRAIAILLCGLMFMPSPVSAEKVKAKLHVFPFPPRLSASIQFYEPSGNPGDTAYSMKDLYGQLESMKARNVTVVIDACFSGMTDSDTKRIIPLIKSASPAFMEVTNPLLKIRNGVVFTSSRGNRFRAGITRNNMGCSPITSCRV